MKLSKISGAKVMHDWIMKHLSIWQLEVPFRFFGALVVGSSLMIMARSLKEAALLGGTFLCGLGALELALRFSGYWVEIHPMIGRCLLCHHRWPNRCSHRQHWRPATLHSPLDLLLLPRRSRPDPSTNRQDFLVEPFALLSRWQSHRR